MSVLELLFWLAVGTISYSFFGYPLLLLLVSTLIHRTPRQEGAGAWPEVTLLVSAYNEETVIGAKLENALALDYPADRLRILVASDGSTDRTDEVVREVAAREERVNLLRQPVRQGKSAALNAALETIRSEVVVFSDANSLYDRQALCQLVRPLADPRVGLVSGRTRYFAAAADAAQETTGLYSKLELWTKRFETRIGSCVGADGAIFACRRALYRPLAPDDLNDLVIPLQVVRQGFRAVLAEEAFCQEPSGRAGGEFKRQVRIACRTLRALVHQSGVLKPWRRPWFALQVISHKALKLLLPYFLLLALGANLVLAAAGSPWYTALLLLQAGGYALAVWGALTGARGRAAAVAYSFCLVGLAFLVGWAKWLSGETFTTWTPERI